MNDYELEQIIRKRHQFRKLLLARERVKQLERELRGDPVRPEEAPNVPQFLRAGVATGLVHSPDAAVSRPGAETAALVTRAMNSWGPHRRTHGLPAPRRLRLIEGSSARNEELIERQAESWP